MNENLKYKILFTIRYLGDGMFYPFFSLYLYSRGLLEERIGLLLSISPLLAIVLNPVYTAICKNDVNHMKKLLGVLSILEGIIIGVMSISTQFYLLCILALLLAITGSVHYGLFDSVGNVYAASKGLNFSSFRIYGSASYILATTLGGVFIKQINYQSSFLSCTLLFILSGIFYLTLKPIEVCEKEEAIKHKKNYFTLFKNKKYISFVLFAGLMTGTFYVTNNFFSNYLYSRGMSEDTYGMVYSFFVAFEVAGLFVLGKIKKKLPVNFFMMIASILLFLRTIVCYLYIPLPGVVLSTALRGLNYAIILHFMYKYIIDLVDKEDGASAIMLYTLIHAFILCIFNNIGGSIIENTSYKTYYFYVTIITIIILIIGIIRYLHYRKEDYKNCK